MALSERGVAPTERAAQGHGAGAARTIWQDGGEQVAAGVTQRSLEREADAHPAVVVEIGVRDPRQRLADRRHCPGLRMRRMSWACLPGDEPHGLHMLRHDGQRFIKERPDRRVIDHRQITDVEIGQALLGPGIGLAGVRMDRMRDELLPQPQHLDRRAPDAGERLGRPIDQQPFRRAADPERWRFAKPLARQPLDLQRQPGLHDVDVDRDDPPADHADARVRPAAPDLELVLGGRASGMTRPVGIVRPCAFAPAPGLFRARHDRQDRMAVGDEPRPEALHEALVGHQ